MKLLGTIFYALGLLFFLFNTVFTFVQPDRFPLNEVVEAALFAALFAVWLWDRFSPIDYRLQFTLGAVVFTWAAVWPEYTLLTALFGAVAALEVFAAYFAWKAHNDAERATEAERVLLDRLIDAQDQAGLDTTTLRDRRNSLS